MIVLESVKVWVQPRLLVGVHGDLIVGGKAANWYTSVWMNIFHSVFVDRSWRTASVPSGHIFIVLTVGFTGWMSGESQGVRNRERRSDCPMWGRGVALQACRKKHGPKLCPLLCDRRHVGEI